MPVRTRPEDEGDLPPCTSLEPVSAPVKWECSPEDEWISTLLHNGIFSYKKEWRPPDGCFKVDGP